MIVDDNCGFIDRRAMRRLAPPVLRLTHATPEVTPLPLEDQKPQAESLYQAILDDISRGRLVGGQRLKVSELAARFGVSASPVREALRQMQGEGFVDIHQNRGATIRKANASTIQNTFEVLQILTPYFVIWFAENADDETIEQLAEIQEVIRTTGSSDLYAFRKLDQQFHGLVCERHYNNVAADTWRKLRHVLSVHAAQLPISRARMKNIITEHDALIEAFRAGDPVEAERISREHDRGSFIQMSQDMRALGG
jgi:DNA-binding GntR family transcriptional regulator